MTLLSLLIGLIVLVTAWCIIRVLPFDERAKSIIGYVLLGLLAIWSLKVLFSATGTSFLIP